MKILYLDCGMGAAGDMLTAALLELFPNKEEMVEKLNALDIPGVTFNADPSVKCGITGTHMTVLVNGEEEHEFMHHHHHDHEHDHEHEHEHDHEHEHNHDHEHEHNHHGHEHSHSGMHDIEHIVRGHMRLPEEVQKDVMAVYGLIAEAESHAHGVPVTEIHFHEVGTMDAVADIAAVCLLLHELAPDRIAASPVHVGSGHVHCAHGILPVPAPATAYILRDVPIYGGAVKGELCTPTGAALLKHFVTEFGDMPVMKTESIGYGMGKKDFEQANCVRALLGETEGATETICELNCNVDDMTGEALGFAMDRLLEAGAREVFTVPVGMKKSRPGILLKVICTQDVKARMVEMMFAHTTTLGIRESEMRRYTLDRRFETVQTAWGPVSRKVSEGYGVKRAKYEYEDLARIAKIHSMSLEELLEKLKG